MPNLPAWVMSKIKENHAWTTNKSAASAASAAVFKRKMEAHDLWSPSKVKGRTQYFTA